MPTYDYQCRSCGTVTEIIHSMLEDGPTTCEHCGGTLRRVFYPTGIIFKGSGFYSTDSRRGGEAAAKGETSEKAASPSSDDGGPTASTKSDTTPDSTKAASSGDTS